VVFNGEEVIHADFNDWKKSCESDGHAEQIQNRAKGSGAHGADRFARTARKAQAAVWYRNSKISRCKLARALHSKVLESL